MSYKYPSAVIGFCGEYILDRKCEEEESDPKKFEGLYTFSFGMEPVGGYTLDKGRLFAD